MKKTFIAASIILVALIVLFLVAANVYPDWTWRMIQSVKAAERPALKVVYMPQPDYPVPAGIQGVQGVVIINVAIGTDGKVAYAVAESGPDYLLRESAEQNAKLWIYQVPPRGRFPLEHHIKYTFIIDKNLAPNTLPTIVTDLPDAVEVISGPMYGDVWQLAPVPSKPKNTHRRSSGK